MSYLKSFFICVIATCIFSCGKDRNVDDYNRNKLNKDVAELQAIQGRYSGYLVSQKDNSRLGALQITLSPGTAPSSGSGSEASKPSSGQPILRSTIQFQGASTMEIAGEQSFYEPTTGQVQTQILIRRGEETFKIYLNAIIRDGGLVGTLEAVGFAGEQGRVELVRDGESLAKLAEKAGTTKPLFGMTHFVGKTKFASGAEKPVRLILLKPRSSSQEEFLNLLVPVKQVIATLNYGDGASISLPNAQLDQRQGAGLLTASAPIGETGISMSLVCHLQAENAATTCEHSTSASPNQVAESNLNVTTQNPPPDDGSSQARDPITRFYNGKGITQGTRIGQVRLTVIYPARTRLAEIIELFVPVSEKILQVTFFLVKGEQGVTFNSSKWDERNGRLEGTFSVTLPTGQVSSFSLTCQKFFFPTVDKYDFSCTYFTSLRPVYEVVRFQSK